MTVRKKLVPHSEADERFLNDGRKSFADARVRIVRPLHHNHREAATPQRQRSRRTCWSAAHH